MAVAPAWAGGGGVSSRMQLPQQHTGLSATPRVPDEQLCNTEGKGPRPPSRPTYRPTARPPARRRDQR